MTKHVNGGYCLDMGKSFLRAVVSAAGQLLDITGRGYRQGDHSPHAQLAHLASDPEFQYKLSQVSVHAAGQPSDDLPSVPKDLSSLLQLVAYGEQHGRPAQ
jgi:hypothetical protein